MGMSSEASKLGRKSNVDKQQLFTTTSHQKRPAANIENEEEDDQDALDEDTNTGFDVCEFKRAKFEDYYNEGETEEQEESSSPASSVGNISSESVISGNVSSWSSSSSSAASYSNFYTSFPPNYQFYSPFVHYNQHYNHHSATGNSNWPTYSSTTQQFF